MEENYYKLLEDFTLYDKDGKYVPQRAVKAVFPTNDSAFGSMKSLIESGLQEDAVIEGKRDKSLSAIVDEIQENLPKTEAEIEETQVEQADHDLEQYSSHETDLDMETNAGYYGGKKETKQGVNGNETRKETREAFIGRAGETSLEVRERGSLAFGYRRYSGKFSQNIQTAGKELKNLGIPFVVFEHFEGNKDGTTTIFSNDALAIPGLAIFIHKDATLDAGELVGHEGYHYLRGSADRINYKEVVAANIDFSSKAIIDYQQKYVGDSYFSEDVVIGSKEWDALMEELYAYITGHIHADDPKGEVHKFLRDYDAAKSALDDLLEKQANQKDQQFSTHETEYSNRDLLANAFEGITKSQHLPSDGNGRADTCR